MTLDHRDGDGRAHQDTVFFKQNRDSAREASRYRFLAKCGVPLPCLLVCIERSDNEVLGLEFLPSIGIEPQQVDSLLRLVAALNATIDVPSEIAGTPPGLPQRDFEDLLAAALRDLAAEMPWVDTTGWLDTYRTAQPRYAALPQALTHGELALQQLGTTADGRLVIFDLATLGVRPRLSDIANVLATLGRVSGRSEHDLLDSYLDQLVAASGAELAADAVWPEFLLTRFVQELEALPWRLTLGDDVDLHQHVMTISEDVAKIR